MNRLKRPGTTGAFFMIAALVLWSIAGVTVMGDPSYPGDPLPTPTVTYWFLWGGLVVALVGITFVGIAVGRRWKARRPR